jgi:hypothetical protein
LREWLLIQNWVNFSPDDHAKFAPGSSSEMEFLEAKKDPHPSNSGPCHELHILRTFPTREQEEFMRG